MITLNHAKEVTHMTDEELRGLLTLISSGDRSAFDRLYSGLSAPVFTIALRITKNRVLAEDTVQEVFIKLYRSPPDGELAKPRAYIFRAAHNTALDMLRKNPPHEDIEEHTDISSPEREDYSDVTAALNSLDEAQRAVVTLHINAGLKFREIAELTGTPLGTVLWRYNKAISRLRQILNGGIS